MRKILVVDGDAASIDVFEVLLKNLGYGVTGISDPTHAVEAIRRNQPDLIFIDWSMLQMDGLQVMRTIRKYAEFDDIPLVVSTDRRPEMAELKLALDAGAFDFIKKPLDEFELTTRVATTFRLLDNIKHNAEQTILQQQQELAKAEMKAILLQTELEEKQREVALMSVNAYQNKKFLSKFKADLLESEVPFDSMQKAHLSRLFSQYHNISNSLNWDFFEKGFVQLHADFYTQLNHDFTSLTWSDLRLCAFFRIGMTIKEVSVVNYSNYETVKKAVHRLRRKLGLTEKEDLNLFLQRY